MKVGQKVTGILFDEGIVVALGEALQLSQYDESGAMTESIATRMISATEPSVAVKFDFGKTAVYPQDEVYEINT